MEDNKLKAIFAEYNPDMQPDELFMDRLNRNLKAIESVKQSTNRLHQRNRLAVLVAAITGFISGIILTICYPYITNYTHALIISNQTLTILKPEYMYIMPFITICLATTILSYFAYDITLLLTRKSRSKFIIRNITD